MMLRRPRAGGQRRPADHRRGLPGHRPKPHLRVRMRAYRGREIYRAGAKARFRHRWSRNGDPSSRPERCRGLRCHRPIRTPHPQGPSRRVGQRVQRTRTQRLAECGLGGGGSIAGRTPRSQRSTRPPQRGQTPMLVGCANWRNSISVKNTRYLLKGRLRRASLRVAALDMGRAPRLRQSHPGSAT